MKVPDTRPAPVCQAAWALAAQDVGSAKIGVKRRPTDRKAEAEDRSVNDTA